jgi:hypothetical protein
MSLTIAFGIVTWVALILLYLALVRVFYELRSTREQLAAALRTSGGQDRIQFPPDWRTTDPSIVLAVDSTCEACWAAIEEAANTTETARPTLLTHEPAERWASVDEKFTIREDTAAWAAVAHLSSPIMLRLDPNGSVDELVLPTRPGDVRDAILRWTATKGEDRDAQLV